MAKRQAQRVLIIRLSALGDVAMTLPVIYSACRQYPDTEFYLLTRPFFAKIFVNAPANLHIIEADLKGRHKGPRGLAKLIAELRGYRFDAVADLHNVLRTWVIDTAMRLSGKRVRMVDKDRLHRKANNHKGIVQRSYIDRYSDVMAAIGYPVTPDFRSVYQDNAPEVPIAIEHPAVGIAPFARYTNKVYPTEMMEQVVRQLNDRGIHVYLFGAKGREADIMESWADRYPLCTSVAGKMPITDEMAVMSGLDLMVSMDSANQHLASLTGIPVMTMWGSTTPICGFAPYRQSADMAVVANIGCQPCTTAGSEKCALGNLACFRQITPEMVVQRILRALNLK